MNPKRLEFPPPGPDVTWAGTNPVVEGLLFGFENGTCMAFSEMTGQFTPPQHLSPSQEAINGVAAVGSESLAVSTRADVTFFQWNSGRQARAIFRGGAHGVIATKGGYFVAPRGPAGLLVVKPTTENRQRMIVTERNESRLYFSRITSVGNLNSGEILICANRRNGVGLSVIHEEETRRNVFTLSFDGVDVVDVCSVSPNSLAAIAISMTAEVFWIKDASRQDNPLVMKLNGVDGPVYRVLATKRHLFVLSSKALYVWTDLVDHVLFGGPSVIDSRPLVLPVQAVDMTLIQDERLLLVLGTNAVMSVTLNEVDEKPTENFGSDSSVNLSEEMARSMTLEEMSPRWQITEYDQGILVESMLCGT